MRNVNALRQFTRSRHQVSVTAFDRVPLSFNSASATAFSVDNIRYTSVVSELSSLLLTAGEIGAR